MGQGKASQQNRGPDPEDQGGGGDGVPREGHRGEGIQVVPVPERGRCRRWRRFN